MVGFAFAIIGIINVWHSLIIPTWVCITIFVLALIVSTFFSFHRIRTERDKLATQLDNLPNIEVKPVVDLFDFYLAVKNNGEGADFKAQVHIPENADIPISIKNPYVGYWVQTASGTSQILRGQTDKLKIAGLKNIADSSITKNLTCFNIYFYSTSTKGIGCFDSTCWHWGQREPEIILDVTISSIPSSNNSVVNRKYKLSSSGLQAL